MLPVVHDQKCGADVRCHLSDPGLRLLDKTGMALFGSVNANTTLKPNGIILEKPLKKSLLGGS